MTPSQRIGAYMLLFCTCAVLGDVYLHNPRGSNNRNCRNDNNDRRRNGNRLFDSQNNDKGGYSCPRAYPFPEGANFNDQASVNAYGDLVSSSSGSHIDTDTFFYYEGTKLNLEWTSQHGCGSNDNLDCRVILQYMCNTDAPSNVDDTLAAMLTNAYLRDGTPINNDDNDNTNDEATTTIPQDKNSGDCTNNNCATDGRYGFHETHEWYEWCTLRERNRGLFTADQLPISGNNRNRAVNTRQDNNGQRRGLECNEERDYYPYWTPTMWKDIAVGVKESEMSTCNQMVEQSQNVVNKCYCDMSNVANPETPYPNNEISCNDRNGEWKCAGRWGLSAPECFAMPWTRDNHLGNNVNGYPMQYNWTLPSAVGDSMRCVLRIRYNTTTGDFPQDLDRLSNCDPNDNQCTNSPIYDRNNREVKTYVQYLADEESDALKLSMAVNTDQYARTFQDRSYVFDIKKVPDSLKDRCNKEIVNINVRGKRGNIVQTYPSVEYDFVPQDVQIEKEDCVHMQWIGSDYNPNRNPNNAEGGPRKPSANANSNEAKADRSNLLEMDTMGENYPQHAAELNNPFFSDSDGNPDHDAIRKFALIDQDESKCVSIEQLREEVNDQNDRQRDPRNCGKLNAATTPYFQGGVYKVYNKGSHRFMSTRNNNFSNRSQKLKIDVSECTYNCDSSSSDGLSGGQIAGVVIGSLAGAGLLAFGVSKFVFKGNAPRIAMGTKPAV